MFDKRIDPSIDANTLWMMLAASGTGLWDWRIDKNTAYYSDEWLAIVGMRPGVFEPRIEFRIGRIHPDDAAYVQGELDAFLRGEIRNAPYIDFRMRRDNGSWAQVRETVGVTERDANGRPMRVTGMMRDNTAAKLREKRLEDECRYHTSVADIAGLMSWEWDIVNDRLTFRLRYSLTDNSRLNPLENKPFKEFLQLVHPDDAPLYLQNLTEYLEKGEGAFEHVLRIMGFNKQYIWVILHAAVIECDDFGKPTKLIGSTLNIDKNIRTESALRAALEENARRCDSLMADIERSERTRKTMFKNSPFACIMFNSDFHVLDCNPAALKLFNFSHEDDFKRDFPSFIMSAIPKRQADGRESIPLSRRLAAAVSDGAHEFETELVLNGEQYPLSVIIKKVDYMDDFALMLYGVDLRKQRDMLSSLRLRDRLLETLNQMAVILMTSKDGIAAVLEKAIASLGTGADVDSAYILKNNEEKDGVLGYSLAGGWMRKKNRSYALHGTYDSFLPGWRDTLAKGEIYNCRVSEIFENEADISDSISDTKISLNIPLFIENAFWGTVGFSRASEDKPFIKLEEDLLQSAGILIASAVTRAAMTDNLLEANRAALAGVQAKTNFLSHMSHEIRTPMNAIIGMTTIAQKASDISRIQYCLKQIENSSRQLLGIINDVLDMSKIEANKLEISNEEFAFEDMIQNVVNVVQVKMDEKGQEFYVNVENVFTRAVISDELRLSQVLINLLTNASKFTPDSGKISLSIRQTPIDNDTVRLHISVADTGIGVTDEQKTRLFHSFEQAESSTTRKYGGTGLGLSISKSIVNLMGGDIWIEDNPGGGSKFAFEIIVKWGKVCRFNKLPKNLRRDLRILVVDDDVNTLDYFESVLAGFSLECDKASCGEDAIALVERREQDGKPYDLTFVDWKMPGMDGGQIAQELTRITRGKSIVVMISVASQDEACAALNPLGLNHFLPKPLLPSTLYNTILSLIGYTGQNNDVDKDETSSHDWSGKKLLLVEDVEVNREVIIGVLEDARITIECAENGARAVEMFDKNDYDIVLMDIQMPVMNGFDATRAIRASGKPRAATCPIIAMTANAFKEDVRECISAGMNNHIAKPIDVKRLFDTLSDYLK
ncbi:MAG: response regulator [Treponema sp.]|jgi:signal transduction histidine kinase/DNA-binding response OmpR family regulator/PAS domain-containing protein|nr:response regulator [Treponema sp.]